jgi:hypothetical protein
MMRQTFAFDPLHEHDSVQRLSLLVGLGARKMLRALSDAGGPLTRAAMADALGVSVGSVSRYAAELAKHQLITVERGERGAAVYRAAWTAIVEQAGVHAPTAREQLDHTFAAWTSAASALVTALGASALLAVAMWRGARSAKPGVRAAAITRSTVRAACAPLSDDGMQYSAEDLAMLDKYREKTPRTAPIRVRAQPISLAHAPPPDTGTGSGLNTNTNTHPEPEPVGMGSWNGEPKTPEEKAAPKTPTWWREDITRPQLIDPATIAQWWQAAASRELVDAGQLAVFVHFCRAVFRMSGPQMRDTPIKFPARYLISCIGKRTAGKTGKHWATKIEPCDRLDAAETVAAVEALLGLRPSAAAPATRPEATAQAATPHAAAPTSGRMLPPFEDLLARRTAGQVLGKLSETWLRKEALKRGVELT